ncbi:MAG: hypothetical protein ACXAB2_06730 [Candidatus Hodarchaeales archaeon]|jgi:hypothetical protein
MPVAVPARAHAEQRRGDVEKGFEYMAIWVVIAILAIIAIKKLGK